MTPNVFSSLMRNTASLLFMPARVHSGTRVVALPQLPDSIRLWSYRVQSATCLACGMQEFKLVSDTLFLGVSCIDRFLSIQNVSRSQLQLVGVTCMFLASKYEEIYAPTVRPQPPLPAHILSLMASSSSACAVGCLPVKGHALQCMAPAVPQHRSGPLTGVSSTCSWELAGA